MNKEKSFFTLNIFIFFTLLYKNISLCISVKMGQPRSLFDLFSSLQTHITFFITNKCEKCPSSIRCWDSNWQTLEHESPPITTRPRKKLRKIRLISTTAQCDQICHFGKILHVFGKMLSLLGQICYIIGLIFIVANDQKLKNNLTICGQSYKHFMLVNYDSRVAIWGIFQSGTTLES